MKIWQPKAALVHKITEMLPGDVDEMRRLVKTGSHVVTEFVDTESSQLLREPAAFVSRTQPSTSHHSLIILRLPILPIYRVARRTELDDIFHNKSR